MKIGIIGSGHVGLVTGACFADLGNEVICMDHDIAKIKLLKRGKALFYEPGLRELVQKNMSKGRIHFTTSISDTVRFAKVIFLCVGTPPKANGEADLAAIQRVAEAIGRNLNGYRLIVEKSTVPVETGSRIYKMIAENCARKISFDIASNAEFLREGSAVKDFYSPDRIVIGVESAKAKSLLLQIYKPFKVPILITDVKSAELIKHAANSFLAMKISYINLMSQICEKVGANVEKVAEGMGGDHRIGKAFLNAGIGFGGSCFPKDLSAFIAITERLQIPSDLLKVVVAINESQQKYFLMKAEQGLEKIKGKKIALLGLSFKPDTDDLRNAPAMDIAEELKAKGARLIAYDPCAMPAAKKLLKGMQFAENAYEACRDADACFILTEWREFRELDLKRLKKLLKHPIVIDGRNIYDPELMKKNGLRYYSIGRREV
ncbi:MAG: UDP-glucose/GDP-mannose dehydrogenase family protein [Candidatus Omnitrophica bacterium]|nr:UDP-glucose/GDP-mannose dehydrogenase family protein [Candidatus Omnitrophota bacterium]